MRSPLHTVTLCSLLLMTGLSTVALAAPAASATAKNTDSDSHAGSIRALQRLETISYKASTSFYLYNVLNRSPNEHKKMQAQIAEGDALLQDISDAAVAPKWNELKRNITSAKYTKDGVLETFSINAVDESLTVLTQTIRTLEAEHRTKGGIAVDKMADMLYDQYVKMQIMTSAYLRKAADSFGGALIGSENRVEIDQVANTFTSQLNQLSVHYAKNKEISDSLRIITTKWTFIKSSFINYNRDSVPFVVGRYNEQITTKLLTAYDQLIL